MSLSDHDPNLNPEAQHLSAVSEKEERRRRRLLLILLLLLLVLGAVLCLGIRYFMKPGPLPDLLPVIIAKNINYPKSDRSHVVL